MTYAVGNIITAADYNGFVSNNPNTNINDIWSTGSTTKGYGQTALSSVSSSAVVGSTEWASLVNTISAIANHQNTTITTRTAPTTGDRINILANVNTDITAITAARGNAVASGTQVVSWTGTTGKTSGTGSGNTSWSITWTHTITFANANAARYFFNAGGRIKWELSKTSTGTLADPDWNDLVNNLCGDIYITGASSSPVSIASANYTGTTKSGGTGTPATLNSSIGWFDLSGTATTLYQQYGTGTAYSAQYIRLQARQASSSQLELTTLWYDPGGSPVGSTDQISGGTGTSSPFTSFGTGPCTLVTYFPPSTTYLTTASWGTPTIAASFV